MRSPINTIFVTIDKKFQDEIKTETLTLYKDTTFAPEWNVTTYGTVVSIPHRVETKFIDEDFFENVLVGDKIYFNYQTLLDDSNCIIHEGIEYWAVEYYNVIALVRDGEIKPVGSYILIEATTTELKSNVVIIPDNCKSVETNKGIVASSNILSSGDIVEYDPVGKFENTIEGKKYYCMYNSNIFLKYGKKAK
jgi:co-chaperonin GroES (HSP10)